MSTENENKEIDRVVTIDINKEMQKCYIDYAMSVIVARALPDVRECFAFYIVLPAASLIFCHKQPQKSATWQHGLTDSGKSCSHMRISER